MRRIPDYPLWLGNARDVQDRHLLFREGVTAAVDLAVEEMPVVPGHEIVYARFPIVDGTENPPWLLRAAVDLTATLLRENVPTLVACGAGLSRSPAIAAAALAKLGRGSMEESLTYLASFGQCDVSAGLLHDLSRAISGGK